MLGSCYNAATAVCVCVCVLLGAVFVACDDNGANYSGSMLANSRHTQKHTARNHPDRYCPTRNYGSVITHQRIGRHAVVLARFAALQIAQTLQVFAHHRRAAAHMLQRPRRSSSSVGGHSGRRFGRRGRRGRCEFDDRLLFVDVEPHNGLCRFVRMAVVAVVIGGGKRRRRARLGGGGGGGGRRCGCCRQRCCVDS